MQNFAKMRINMLALQIKDFFFPKFCCHCGLTGDFLCESCERSLKEVNPESFISRNPSSNWDIEPSLKNQTILEKVYYFYEYSEVIHSLISEIKYQYYSGPTEKVFDLITKSKEFRNIDFSNIDYIISIPISLNKKLQRGFNHTEIIAENISKVLNKSRLDLLVKRKETKSQADLERSERLSNLQDSFGIKENIYIESDAKILVIDDICTTGSTLNEAAKTIKLKFPHSKIYGLTLARGK